MQLSPSPIGDGLFMPSPWGEGAPKGRMWGSAKQYLLHMSPLCGYTTSVICSFLANASFSSRRSLLQYCHRCVALVGAVIDRPPCLPRFEGGGFAARRRRRELTPPSHADRVTAPSRRGGQDGIIVGEGLDPPFTLRKRNVKLPHPGKKYVIPRTAMPSVGISRQDVASISVRM